MKDNEPPKEGRSEVDWSTITNPLMQAKTLTDDPCESSLSTEDKIKASQEQMAVTEYGLDKECAKTYYELIEEYKTRIAQRLNALLLKEGKLIVPEVSPWVDVYYSLPNNGAGGNLHIVLEDANVKDNDVLYCIEAAEKDGDLCGSLLGKILLRMSKTQRLKLTMKNYPSRLYIPIEDLRKAINNV